jgi:hypothetical protein
LQIKDAGGVREVTFNKQYQDIEYEEFNPVATVQVVDDPENMDMMD